jgi:hypothetical protein
VTYDAVHLARQVAARSGQQVQDLLAALAKRGFVEQFGRFYATGELDTGVANPDLVKLLGVTVVLGSVRVSPAGEIDILIGCWRRVTPDLLDALEAERRLGGAESAAHQAAQLIRRWQKKTTKTKTKVKLK